MKCSFVVWYELLCVDAAFNQLYCLKAQKQPVQQIRYSCI